MKSNSRIIVALLLTFTTIIPAVAQDDLATRLDAVDDAHPRLFFATSEEPVLKSKIQSDPLLQGVFDHIIAGADATLDMEPVERKQVGKRLLGVSRTCLQRVSYLAFAHRLTDNDAYLDRAEREMVAAANFSDWNPSHFLDVAEMTAALAIGYDWLYNDLDPEARKTIRDAIMDKGLKTSLDGGWWVTTENNWNQVCHGGLTLGALAVLEDEPELAEQIITRALDNLPRAMHEYEPDGVYPEGPSYWKYGTTYNVILIDALQSVLSTDFGLSSHDGFMKSPEFYLHATGPTGKFYNFSDCGLYGGISPAMHWFAAQHDDPSLLWREKDALAEFIKTDPRSGRDRTLPFLLIWGQPLGDIPAPEQHNWQGDGPTPIALFRSGWNEDAAYLGIKGGSPSTNHAHMDIGSFVYGANGVRWAIDLGAQSYNSLESAGVDLWNKSQKSERWTVFRLNNFSHNTLVVDDQLQRVKGDAPITSFSADNATTIIDMTSVYDGQLAEAKRGAQLIDKSALIQDEIKTLDNQTTIRWGMATNAAVELNANTATLTQDDQTLTLHVLAPTNATLETYEMENPPRDYDAKNPNTRMVGFKVDVPASTTQTLAVYLTPGESAADAPNMTALADWN